MNTVQRLDTFADLGAEDGIPDDRYQPVTARLEAVLSSGCPLVLLDDRGWSSSGPAGAWRYESADSVTATARMVVGPDEPRDGESYEQAEADYWAHLVDTLQRRDIPTTAEDLANLPHHVVLSDRVLALFNLQRQSTDPTIIVQKPDFEGVVGSVRGGGGRARYTGAAFTEGMR